MIVLIHDFVVDVSQNVYTLMRDKHKKDKKGNHLYDILGYYGKLESAIKAARERLVKERMCDGVFSLTQAIEIIKQVNNEFCDLLKGTLNND